MSGIPHKSKDSSRGVFVDTSCITPLPSSQLLNYYSVKHDPHCVDNIIRNGYNDPEFWHRFTICNESYSCSDYPKYFILKVITDFVYPHELLPVHVSQKATKTFFLARNCLQAVIKLCKAGLTVPNPNRPDSPFKIVIIKDVLTLKHIPLVNVEPNITEVLKKRHNKNILDLSRFHEDKDLREFCPLSQPKLLLYVLSLSEKVDTYHNKILRIVLSHNDIKCLPNFESLSNWSVNSIDLSNNKIQNIEDIVPLKDFPTLVAVQLDGNPLCCRFDSGLTYFLYVKSICRNLTTLDYRRLCEEGLYKKHRTFLCDAKGFNFANQFLEQYFTYYDELNRPNIESFYSEDAMFSLTYRDILDRYSRSRQTREFKIRNRNIISPMWKTRNEPNTLFFGKENVLEQLYCFPSTRHHPHSFYIDLMAYSKTQAIIYVTGVFRDSTDTTFIYGFTRNFVLSSKDSKEWIITNDQLFVYTPYKYKANLGAWPAPMSTSLFPEPCFNQDHMNDLALTFVSITGMAYEHSKKFLEKNNWNLELALKVFIDEHINDEIPDEVFDDERNEEQEEGSDDDDVIITEDDILPPIEKLVIAKSKSPPQSISPGANESTNSTAIVSSECWIPVENQMSTSFLERPSTLNHPFTRLSSTSIPTPLLPSPSSQHSSTDPLPKLKEPELDSSSSLPLSNEEELAEMVILRPKSSDWSPEMRARLAELRPPGLAPEAKLRYRLTTRTGKVFRVYLPKK